MTQRREAREKEDLTEKFSETSPLKGNKPKRRGEVLLRKRTDLLGILTKEDSVFEVECVIIGISRIAHFSQEVDADRERIVRLSTNRNKIDPAPYKKKTSLREVLAQPLSSITHIVKVREKT